MQQNETLTSSLNDTLELAKCIISVLIEKKALDVRLYTVKEKSSVTDYYVNATGRSSTQVAALADEIAYRTGLNGRDPLRIEGRAANTWLLVDYGDVIVNIFDKPSREFYNFDRLMPEDGELDISDIEEAVDRKFEINKQEER